MSARSAAVNLPLYMDMPPLLLLMAPEITKGAFAPLRILFMLGGMPWQLLQVLAV